MTSVTLCLVSEIMPCGCDIGPTGALIVGTELGWVGWIVGDIA